MKCQMCNGEGGKIPHPENYGSYREDCPACNGTGEQAPVDKIPVCPKCESLNQCQHCGHCTKCCSIEIEALEAKLSVARAESDSVHKMFDTEHEKLLRVEKKNKQLKADNERLAVYEKAVLEIQKELYNDTESRDWIKYLRKNVELQAENKRLKDENMCDACLGTGDPTSGKPCMCGGSGKMSDAAIYLREQMNRVDTENERYLAAIKEFCDRSKWAVDSWKKQDYIAALFEIANQGKQVRDE